MPTNPFRLNTLRGHLAFAKVLSSGLSIKSGPLRCFYLRKEGNNRELRIGIAVTRNVRSAVERNRIKRLVREALRANQSGLKDLVREKSVDIVFLCNKLSTKGTSQSKELNTQTRQLLEVLVQR